MLQSRTATFIGISAILMWATLGVLTALAAPVPPFQLVTIAMGLGGLVGVVSWPFRPHALAALRQPLGVWAFGVGGIFGYHALYFAAMRLAPPVEANLVNYLWPLLIVLFSALLPGEKVRAHHLTGALLGLGGAVLIVTGGGGLNIRPEFAAGYLAALGCAVVWAGYSVLSRRFKAVPTDTVVVFCLLSAALSLVCHLAFETTLWPTNSTGWLALLAIGLLPTGLAFYVWDIGMKHGDIQALGALSYATPILSTGLLIAAGFAKPGLIIGAALLLVTLGAVIASKDLILRRDQGNQ